MVSIAAAFSYYRSLPNWAQLVIQWGIRAAIASFILAQWSSVATYWYAMRYGARPPVEGVPFLALTVAVLGLVLLAFTIVIFYFFPVLTTIFKTTFYKNKSISNNIMKILRNIAICAAVFSIIFLCICFYIGFYIEWKDIDYLYAVIWRLLFVLLLLNTKVLADKNVRRLSFGLYAFSVVSLMVAMLSAPFDHILRTTRFGGGVKVDVELRDKERLTGQSLFLTSANFVTVYDPATARFRELNRDHIVQIEYGGVAEWNLPREKQYAEIFGFDDLSANDVTATGATNVPNPGGQP